MGACEFLYSCGDEGDADDGDNDVDGDIQHTKYYIERYYYAIRY